MSDKPKHPLNSVIPKFSIACSDFIGICEAATFKGYVNEENLIDAESMIRDSLQMFQGMSVIWRIHAPDNKTHMRLVTCVLHHYGATSIQIGIPAGSQGRPNSEARQP